MRPRSYLLLAVAIVGGSAMLDSSVVRGAPTEEVRPARCAGTWYPGDADVLAREVDEWLSAAATPKLDGKPIAVIAPHAGYRYSGRVAAAGYAGLRGHRYGRVIVLALSHRYANAYDGVDVPPAELKAYHTPLGDVPIDQEVVAALRGRSGFVSNPLVGRDEHSLELQLPFLQRVLGDFRLVPLLVGRMRPESDAVAAQAITKWVTDDTLLVVSTDFTHFGPNYGYQPFKEDVPDQLRKLAEQAAAPILACDFDGFAAHLERTKDTICGRGPVLLLLRVLSMGGGAQGVVTGFDTSGHMTGDWTNSVTYQSIVFTRRPDQLNEHERQLLLQLARRTVTAVLNGEAPPKVDPAELPAALRKDGACFVTLENHGELRGCIGNMRAVGPLYQAVIVNAVSSCTRDYRFANNPVTAQELSRIDIEISYLTPMQRVKETSDIVIGRDGLYIVLGGNRGVLLPQVAYERGWTRDQFLAQTCRKAGLPLAAWKDPAAQIYSFEAEVFGEPQTTTAPSAH
jgi:AmmeMemoRadiSam system protein B/AmmeMemoRadiSam system protein A